MKKRPARSYAAKSRKASRFLNNGHNGDHNTNQGSRVKGWQSGHKTGTKG
jgi:hypothetical protein